MKPRLLLDDLKPGVDEGKVSWYPEPHVIVHKPDEAGYIEIKGTFRSADCSRSGDSGAFEDEMCAACTNIPGRLLNQGQCPGIFCIAFVIGIFVFTKNNC